jgi:hypothetical protein
MVTKGQKIIGIKTSWVKKNIPWFNLKLEEFVDSNYFEVISTLEKYTPKVKTFNPISLNLDSTMVKYFSKDGERIPYFTKKGYMKIKVLFNDVEDEAIDWLYKLTDGELKSQIKNLENVREMVNLNHVPILKHVNGKLVFSDHIYNIDKDDIIIDFKRVGDLKKEYDRGDFQDIEGYKCPLYSQMQLNFQKALEDVEKNFENKINELKQEKVIQHLKQELDKEKSLKDQVLSLTQSILPLNMDQSPHQNKPSNKSILKPSKIH